jgi:predicted transcriptional regulator
MQKLLKHFKLMEISKRIANNAKIPRVRIRSNNEQPLSDLQYLKFHFQPNSIAP